MRIDTIDLQFQGVAHAIAAYLVRADAGPVLVETGPFTCHEALAAGLADYGLTPSDVRHVVVTHIHLDHAGAAGWWARQGSTVYVHEFGAPHLVDPSKLLASASRIYGDAMDRLWGEIVPAPADRVVAVADGDRFELEGIALEALSTPGHAGHHHVWSLGEVAFTGDAAGIRLPGTSWVDLPAPPPEYDLEGWLATLDRLRQRRFERIYPTHFGPVDEVGEQLQRLEQVLRAATAFVGEMIERGTERAEMIERYVAWLEAQASAEGVDEETLATLRLANPRDMSVDGIARYWRKRKG